MASASVLLPVPGRPEKTISFTFTPYEKRQAKAVEFQHAECYTHE
jgi:hypothetical protein